MNNDQVLEKVTNKIGSLTDVQTHNKIRIFMAYWN